MRYVLIAVTLLITLACIPKTPEDFKNEESLHAFSMELVEKGKDQEALKFLSTFKTRYPLSPRTPLIQLTLADLNFKRREFTEAIGEYDQFIELYPTNPKINYAQMQAARAHTEQIPSTIDRDQGHVALAIEKYQRLTNDPTYGKEALESANKMHLLLAQRDRYIANYYMKQKQWAAAEIRLLDLSNNQKFPDLREQAIYDLVQVFLKQGKTEAAALEVEKLERSSTNDALKEKAKNLLIQKNSLGR